MAIEYFNAYHSYLDSLEPLNDTERGRLFTALLIYSSTGAAPELRGNERFVFPAMKGQIDRDRANYYARCATNSENGKKGGRPKNQTVFTETEKSERFFEKPKKAKENEKEKEKEKEKEDNPRVTRFTPPTVEEVAAYCQERGNSVDPQRFVDFYASKGWKVGKDPMQDWKAAVRTWEKRDESHSAPGRYQKQTKAEELDEFYDMAAEWSKS